MAKRIKINVVAARIVPLSALRIIQGNLKSLSKNNFTKLRNEMADSGISFAVHAWENPNTETLDVLDGTQRVRVLRTMVEKEGFIVDGVPVNIVSAKNCKEAIHKLLTGASQYGRIDEDGLRELMAEYEIEPGGLENIDFADINLDKFIESHFEGHGDLEKIVANRCPNCGFEI